MPSISLATANGPISDWRTAPVRAARGNDDTDASTLAFECMLAFFRRVLQ